MINRVTDVFIAFCLVFQVTESLDKLIAFRETNKDHWKFMCAGEDNGDAYVWNIESNWQSGSIFKSTLEKRQSYIDCPHIDGICYWHNYIWNISNSKENPMGLVLDSTWEDFREYNNIGKENKVDYVDVFPKKGSFAFSVRGTNNVAILLCNTQYYAYSSCFRIKIGDKNTVSTSAEVCSLKFIGSIWSCDIAKYGVNNEVYLSPNEWKHYVLTWDGDTKNVTLYNDKKQLLTHIFKKNSDQFDEFYLFHSSPKEVHIRYHQYSYYYTKNSHLTIYSFSQVINTKNFCIRLSIGLCAKCGVSIVSKTQQGYQYEETLVKVLGTMSIHGLPTWQHVKVNMTTSNFSLDQSVSIHIQPFIEDENDAEGFWAVRNITKCSPPGTMKISSITHLKKGSKPLSSVTCQRISYTRKEVVDAHDKAVELETDDYDCPNGTMCSFSCKSFNIKFNENCQNTVICNEKGCTCYNGLTGDNCEKYCDNNKYGYMCKQTCGQCLKEQCHPTTGLCPNKRCNNTGVYYVPPYCDTEISAPSAPNIISYDETSVRVSVIAKDEYKTIQTEYTFVIKNESNIVVRTLPNRVIFQNATTLEATIDKLNPGTFYSISCHLIIKNDSKHIKGDSKKFRTSCTDNTNFTIVAGVTNLTIINNIDKTVLNWCPLNLYTVVIKTVDKHTKIGEENFINSTVVLEKLEPGTDYKVFIKIKGDEGKRIMRLVSTKDGVFSPVEQLRCYFSNDTNALLKWEKPKNLLGQIKSYEIILKTTTYHGCLDLKRKIQFTTFIHVNTSTTFITFLKLQPYATYTATIYAWNSNRGEPATVNFTTEAAKISRFNYTHIRKVGDKLVWDLPEDCTIISGPIVGTKLIFIGTREDLGNYTYVLNKTHGNSFDLTTSDLYGKERYKVFVRPLHDLNETHNSNVYASFDFETPPKAPTRVRELEIVEVNNYTNSILLRWQKPYPPNGEIDHYVIANCTLKNCMFLIENLSKNNYCPLWDTYICTTITQNLEEYFNITVYAINENVNKDGERAYAYYNSSLVPGPPENVTVQIFRGSTVTLSWFHPWRTRLPLEKFAIRINVIESKLKQQFSEKEEHIDEFYSIVEYKRVYTMDFHLAPSTQYEFFVYSVTIHGNRGESRNISFNTPDLIAFEENLSYRFHDGTIVCIKIPKIIYKTQNSRIYFVVKGNNPCKEHVQLSPLLRNYVNIKPDEVAWLAANFSADKYSDNEFCVGNNTIYPENCPLKENDLYMVFVIVQPDENSTKEEIVYKYIQFGNQPEKHSGLWALSIVIILIIGVITYYLFRRRARMLAREEQLVSKHISIVYTGKEIRSKSPNLLKDSPLCQSTTDLVSLSIESIPNDDNSVTPIKVKDFEDYVKNAVESGLLDKQYKSFPRGPTKPCSYGKLAENVTKNRYKNLIAYDETRVILKKQKDDPFSDYINANYIKGYNMEKRYIATQGPKPNTIIDFWRMIWQENVTVICMLANVCEQGKVKCDQYWPDIGKKKKYGDIKVFHAKHDVFADYTFRILHVTCNDETRQVKHLHYTTWPDHGVPTYTHSVLAYLKKLLATKIETSPIVVHCSAGVGRTGTIILCDICLRRAAAEGVIDVFSETQSIRDQRVNMVDNKQQYLFAHIVLVEYLSAVPTTVPCDQNFSTRIIEMKEKVNIQFQRLKNSMWQYEAIRPTIQHTLSEVNVAKHRYPELISNKVTRIYLNRYPVQVEDSDYIAAVYVDGLRIQNQYLASQLPLPSTFSDFWRMIAELNVELIIVLQPPDPDDPTCCPIVPTDHEFKPTSYLSVISNNIVNDKYYVSHTLKLIDNSKTSQPEQSITILNFTQYKPGRNMDPPPIDALIKLWQATERVARGNNPTVVLCHDGVTGCGLYLALSFLLEKMTTERECDVFLAIQTVQRSRLDFIRSVEQMVYLYDAALAYVECFKTYANFS